MPADRIALLENLVQGTVRPDHVILLDAPVETGMTRARHRGDLDRFEQEAVAFLSEYARPISLAPPARRAVIILWTPPSRLGQSVTRSRACFGIW